MPVTCEVEDAANLGDEEGDVVATPLLAEAAEVGEIAPNLRGGDADAVGKVVRGDGGYRARSAHRAAGIDRQATNDDFGDFPVVERARWESTPLP